MELIKVKKLNEVYFKITADPSTMMELNEYFTFDVPGAKFSPKFKNKVWDGKIRLFNAMTGLLYCGLNKEVEKFCKSRGYNLEYQYDTGLAEFSLKEANEFINWLKIPEQFERRDYQIEAFVHAIRNRRGLLLSPTASGKSFIIYLIVRYYEELLRGSKSKFLIIVPNTNLVNQLTGDFADYGYVSDRKIHRIFAGQDKNTDKLITISTWQSLYKLPKEYFKQFDIVIGDEAHLFKAKSLVSIMSSLIDCKYRFGFTGTLDGALTNELVLQGLFGPTKKVVSTAELIEQKHISQFEIKAIVLKHGHQTRKDLIKADYPTELDFLVRNEHRNRFITNLALSLKGNTIILFQFIEKHGDVLLELLNKQTEIPVYYIHGGIDTDDREEIRKIVKTKEKSIILASSGTMSTGANIPNLTDIIFASPSKARVKTLQSIGRGLRKSPNKELCTLYDIADDLTWKTRKNYTITHFVERIKMYNDEKFEYKVYPVNLKE